MHGNMNIKLVDELMRLCGTGGVLFTFVCVPGTIGHTVHYCRSLPIAETLSPHTHDTARR